ncbi:hypothetical protein [Streptomyces sp. B21-083]|uniref:hypothetical protein n=1 Tax=Streptomyces sp. B21-083 TaxID=3039410 RepID=UPI002FEFF494
MASIHLASSITHAMDDPEFSREMRYFDGRLKIGAYGEETVAEFHDGKLAQVAVEDTPDADCKIIIRGTAELWDNLLARYPVPFYQCLQTCNIKHGLEMSTTNETYAYLPALNRLVQILRADKNEGS